MAAILGLVISCMGLASIIAISFITLLQHHAGITLAVILSFQVLVPTTLGVFAMQNGMFLTTYYFLTYDRCVI